MYSIINWKQLHTLPKDYNKSFLVSKVNKEQIQAITIADLGNHIDTKELYIKLIAMELAIPYSEIAALSVDDKGEGMMWAEFPTTFYTSQ